MKNNINIEPLSDQAGGNRTPATPNSQDDNEINTGSMGFGGDGNNGAAALRDLRKKHGGTDTKTTSNTRHIL